MKRSRLQSAILALVAALILLVTLEPLRGAPPAVDLCLYCGLRAIADGVLNVLLFLPLGAALAWRFGGALRCILAGALLSLGVEALQLWIPGRDPSLSDLLSNTLGTTMGVLLVRHASGWLVLPWRHPRVWAGVTLCAAALVLTTAALLLQPQLPTGRWFVRWGTSTEVDAPFDGRVSQVVLGRVVLRQGWLSGAQTDSARQALEVGLPFTATARLPWPPDRRVAGIVGLADGPNEVVMLGVAGDAAVFRFRTRAARWHLDQPDLRLAGALAGGGWPREIQVSAWRQGSRYCMAAGGRGECNLGFTLGDTRSLLLNLGASPVWLRRLLGALWLALVFAPAAVGLRRWGDRAALAAAIVALLVALPPLTELIPTPVEQYPGALAGILAGAWISERFRRRRTLPPAPPRTDRSSRS